MADDVGQETAPNLFKRWSRIIRCSIGHNWDFRHDETPPIIVCTRCGRAYPMPYGDARMPYL